MHVKLNLFNGLRTNGECITALFLKLNFWPNAFSLVLNLLGMRVIILCKIFNEEKIGAVQKLLNFKREKLCQFMENS